MNEEFLNLIDQRTTGNRCDVTPLFADSVAFDDLLNTFIERCGDIAIDSIACLDALGFVLGTGLAIRMRKQLILIRKGGKLPVRTISKEFVDYTGQAKSLEIRLDAVDSGTRVLVIDDWIETGAQVSAAISLLESRGAIVAGIAAVHIGPKARVKLGERQFRLIAADVIS